MKRRKNLERAVVLGLLLSTSVYGNAFAIDVTVSSYVMQPDNYIEGWDGKITAPESLKNLTVSDETAESIFKYGVLVTADVKGNDNLYQNIIFDWKLNSLNIDITKLVEGSTSADNYYIAGVMVDGFDDEKTANLILTTNDGINVKVNSQNNYAAVGVWAQSDDSIKLNSKNGNVTVDVTKTGGSNLSYKDGGEEDRTLHAVYGLNASNDRYAASYDPNDESRGSEINITTDNGSISVTAKNEYADLNSSHVYAAANDNGHLILTAGQGADYTGTGSISLKAKSNGNNNVYGLDTWGGEENRLTADKIYLSAKAENGNAYGLKVSGGADDNQFNADCNEIIGVSGSGEAYGIWADDDSRVDVTGKDNFISGTVTENPKKGTGIMVDDSIVFIEGNNNYINAAVDTDDNVVYLGKAEGLAVDANNASTVVVKGNASNAFGGAVYANGLGTSVIIEGKDIPVTNNFYSASIIENAGGLEGKKIVTDNDGKPVIDPETGKYKVTGLDVVSALYAENGATINVSGNNDFRTYYSDPSDTHTSERVVWAYDTADITIDGHTNISTTFYEVSPNSKDIAIAAGTATDLNPNKVNAAVSDRATVTLTYDNYNDGNGNEDLSYIKGDILSAYEGLVDIKAKEGSNAGINITGNLLAGNNGILNVDLGKGGTLTGRADDYGDAGANEAGVGNGNDGHQSLEFFDPAFSSDIFKGGEVNLTMGEGSSWNVTGQSWITRINTNDSDGNAANNAVIDLVTANTNRNTTAHALTVYEMNGDATFNMSLDRNRDTSDMLYIKNAQGDYIVNVFEAVTTGDMYANGFDGLRFATVGAESNATFRAVTVDQGVFNVEYEVGTDKYNTSKENNAYNGIEMSEHKPGSDLVDDFFESNGKPGSVTETVANTAKNIMLLDEINAGEEAAEDSSLTETTNFKLIGRKGDELSDAGKTMLNMSRANYSNAIYMDRLNKRLGEARYINAEENEGMWVRIRHDRIGKTDAYRSQNTMYELGYDVKQECDNGERRVGFAVDYMHGDTGYSDVAGKGELDRYGLWLYDTWMGDKGHYVDYVAKWGHLDNDFEVYTMSEGKKVTGDYSNNVFSVSAEYGRKKDIGSDWYFEPQAQLQLARVTGADYTTSQGTKVSVDGINSLIGRAGFRIGKDFGEQKQSTVYIKADVLHEFLGDQDVSVMDDTTNGRYVGIGYENEGTWYDVGFGFATQTGKNSYAFMDFEKSFGHDNDETYQINAGVQWTF